MKKGQVYEGIIEKVEFPNKGIVSVEGEEKKVIVKNGIPGQKIRFAVNKMRKGKAEGRLLEVLKKSPLEIESPTRSILGFEVSGTWSNHISSHSKVSNGISLAFSSYVNVICIVSFKV